MPDSKDQVTAGSDSNVTKSKVEQSVIFFIYPPYLEKPEYDILGYTTKFAVKITSLANPNDIPVYYIVLDCIRLL